MSKIKMKYQNENNKNKKNVIKNTHYIPLIEKMQFAFKKNPLKIIEQEKIIQKFYLNLDNYHEISIFIIFIHFIISKIILKKKAILFINWFLIFNLIILLNIQMVISEKNINKIYLNSSSITLKIKGPGTQNIISSEFSGPHPDSIYINEEIIENINNNYYFISL